MTCRLQQLCAKWKAVSLHFLALRSGEAGSPAVHSFGLPVVLAANQCKFAHLLPDSGHASRSSVRCCLFSVLSAASFYSLPPADRNGRERSTQEKLVALPGTHMVFLGQSLSQCAGLWAESRTFHSGFALLRTSKLRHLDTPCAAVEVRLAAPSPASDSKPFSACSRLDLLCFDHHLSSLHFTSFVQCRTFGRGCSPCHCAAPMPCQLLVSLPHHPFSRCLLGIWTWQMRLFACRRLTHRSPFRTRLRWPSLWCWTTASAIFCVASALQCGWPSWMTWPPSCRSTSERLGFSFHLAPICCTASSLSSLYLSSPLTCDRQR